MTPFNKCPICGGEMIEKEVEKLLRGGDDSALIRVPADVCLNCGERLYSPEVVRCFERIRDKLKSRETGDLRPIGTFYQVVECDAGRYGNE